MFGPWLTAFAYGTSYFSAVIFIGYAGQFGWKFGLASTWIGLGNAFIGSLLAWNVLGRRTRTMSHHLESKTMPEFFGVRFDSKMLKILALPDRICIPDSVYGIALQRTFKIVRDGVSPGLYGLHRRDGSAYRNLCDRRRLHGDSHQ